MFIQIFKATSKVTNEIFENEQFKFIDSLDDPFFQEKIQEAKKKLNIYVSHSYCRESKQLIEKETDEEAINSANYNLELLKKKIRKK